MDPQHPSLSRSRQGTSLYLYPPSLWLPLLFGCLYGTASMLHILQIGSTRHRYMLIVFVGCLACGAGNATRVYSHYRPEDSTAWIAQEVILLVGPSSFASTIFLVLSRMMELFGREVVVFLSRPKSALAVMVALDLLGLTIQGIGLGLKGLAMIQGDRGDVDTDAGDTLSSQGVAADGVIVLVGLGIQLAAYNSFLVALLTFSLRTTSAHGSQNVKQNPYWTRQLRTLSSSLTFGIVFLLLRCIFRMVQTSMGPQGLLERTEWYFYVFDQTPALLSVLILNALHPGNFLPVEHREAVAAGRLRRQGPISSHISSLPMAGGEGGGPVSGKGRKGRKGAGISYGTASSFYCAEAGGVSIPPHSSTVLSLIRQEDRKASEEGYHSQQAGAGSDSDYMGRKGGYGEGKRGDDGYGDVVGGADGRQSTTGKHDFLYPYEEQGTHLLLQTTAGPHRLMREFVRYPAAADGHLRVDSVYEQDISPRLASSYGGSQAGRSDTACSVDMIQRDTRVCDGFGGLTPLAPRPQVTSRAAAIGAYAAPNVSKGDTWSISAMPSHVYGSALTRSWGATHEDDDRTLAE